MEDIFSRENTVIAKAEAVLEPADQAVDPSSYRFLLDEYKLLLRQFTRLVKVSDIMQLELKTLSDKLEQTARVDALTELCNRRSFNEAYAKEWRNALRNKTELAALMIDIDDFKAYNDTYGHLEGDECLIAVAKQLQGVIKRPRDIVARFGGEEFVMLLPETGIEGAKVVAQAALDAIDSLQLVHRGAPKWRHVTISIGVAAVVPNEQCAVDSLVQMADKALYQAKLDGKHCYRLYQA